MDRIFLFKGQLNRPLKSPVISIYSVIWFKWNIEFWYGILLSLTWWEAILATIN
jgi:hypothetical protein